MRRRGYPRDRHGPLVIGSLLVLTVAVAVLVAAGFVRFNGDVAEAISGGSTSDPGVPSVFEPTPVAAFLGDSFTEGSGLPPTERPFPVLVSAEVGWGAVNFGQGGTGYANAGTAGGKPYGARVDAIVASKPDVVVVAGGGNDYGAPDDELRAAVRGVLTRLHAGLPKVPIYVVSPIWGKPPAGFDQLIADVREAATGLPGVTYLDIGQPLVGHPKLLQDDGVHPNEQGAQVIADAIVKQLNAVGVESVD